MSYFCGAFILAVSVVAFATTVVLMVIVTMLCVLFLCALPIYILRVVCYTKTIKNKGETKMTNLTVVNAMQEKIENKESIIGTKVFGVCGGFVYHEGVVRKLTVYDHRLFGRLVQVWVEWFNHDGEDFYTKGHLEPFEPRQFKKWQGSSEKIGVYFE